MNTTPVPSAGVFGEAHRGEKKFFKKSGFDCFFLLTSAEA